MLLSRLSPSGISLKVTNLNSLEQFHAQLIHHSLHGSCYWAAEVISFCTRLHGTPPYVRAVFNAVHHPDVRLFASMIRYCSEWGANSEIAALFEQMQKRSLWPDTSVYPILIKAAVENGSAFHSHLIKIGAESDTYIRNALITMYGKYGPIQMARELFDEMGDRKCCPDWNAMISGYWNWGDECEAKVLFDLMPEKNVVTWTAMVTGYSKMNDLEKARIFFDQMPKKNLVSWNAMLSGYAQNGFHKEALSLFNQMVSIGVKPGQKTWCSIISSCSAVGDPGILESLVKMLNDRGIRLNLFGKTALLDLYAKCGHLEMAVKLFNELGECRNLVAWNSMISGYMKIGASISARELFDQMQVHDVISWNTMIAGYAQNGQSELAIDLFKEMTKEGVASDEVTIASVISACGHLGSVELGNWIVKFITDKNIKLSLSGYNSMIYMYARCGKINEAKMIFHEMNTRDIISCNALIAGFAAHGKGIETLEVLQGMIDEGIEPDRVTYIGVLKACSHAGMIEEGRKVFESIKFPDIDHYACMVDLLGREGRLDEAKIMIDKMPEHPHAGMYGSLLNASRMHKRIDLGEFAASKLLELEPENSGNYVLLSNLYASAGRWKEVGRIRKSMKTKGVMKTAGWSWVEHVGKMHKFMVGDRSHEQSTDIYNLLAKLRGKLQAAGYSADRSSVLRDVEEEEKEEMVGIHSEKLAVAFCLLVSEPRTVIRIMKNLRICWDCHDAMKMISELEERGIIVRDNERFHHFKSNKCSCNDYW